MLSAVGIDNPAFEDYIDTESDNEEVQPKTQEIVDFDTPIIETEIDENDNLTETDFNDTKIESVSQYSPASNEFIKCRITRNRKGIEKFGHPTYHCFLDSGGLPTNETNPKLILTARKRKKAKSSTYLIATNEYNLNKDAYIAKVKSNLVGTRFTCYDSGESFQDPACNPDKELKREFASIIYDQNVLGFKGPRKMTIVLPKMDPETRTRIECQPTSENMTILSHFDEGNLNKITVHHNRQPMWNDSTQSYVLNFNGRVTQASVKNFQITSSDDPNETIMQFGRIKNDIFTMDYRYPMSPVQAFAIALSSFDPKIACE